MPTFQLVIYQSTPQLINDPLELFTHYFPTFLELTMQAYN